MQSIFKAFKKKKVLTIDELIRLQNCSIRTAQRRLKKWGSYRSFNQNGRYYTLPDIPDFDGYGLWRYQDIFFSMYGNLKKTVIYLIQNSDAGLSAADIGNLVGLSPRSFMSHFRDIPSIRREKQHGRYVYFSKAVEIYKSQLERRLSIELIGDKPITGPSDADAVKILVLLIKHPDISIEDLANKAAEQGVPVKAAGVRNFLSYHDLIKKMPDTRR